MSPRLETDAPLSQVEAELKTALEAAVAIHTDNPTPETWQRRIAARAAYQAIYDWNRAS